MSQLNRTDLSAMREILEQMRDHLERLRQDNKELKEENRSLRAMLLQQREPTRPHRSRHEGLDFNTPMPSEYEVFHEPGDMGIHQTHSGVGHRPHKSSRHHDNASAHPRLSPTHEQRGDDYDLYRPTRQRRQSSPAGYLGAGVSADEARARGTTPSRSMPRPALDIGYINAVSPEELDALPYGLVVLDTQGQVLFYNETESSLTGFARERVIGKNFFTKVAPCTQVQAFQGRFEQFVRGELGRVTFFDFAFHFEQGTQNVVIGLSHGRKQGHINVMMVRK